MENNYLKSKPTVLLVGEPEGVSISLAELFLGNLCSVFVLGSDKASWLRSTQHLKENINLLISDKIADTKRLYFDYVVYTNTSSESPRNEQKYLHREEMIIKRIFEIVEENFSKAIFALPFAQYTDIQMRISLIVEEYFGSYKSGTSLIYMGEVLGPRISLQGNDPLLTSLRNLMAKKEVSLPNNTKLFPLYVADVCRFIVKSLMSFGNFGLKTSLLSRSVGVSEFFNLLKTQANAQTKISDDDSYYSFSSPTVDKQVFLDTNIQKALKETINWYVNHQQHFVDELKKGKNDQVKILSKENQTLSLKKPLLYGTLFALFSLILLPLLLSLFGGVGLFLARYLVVKGELGLARKTLRLSTLSAMVAKNEFRLVSLKTPEDLSSIIERASQIGIKTIDLIDVSKELGSKVVGEEVYSPRNYSNEISLLLDSIYKETGFLQSDFQSLTPFVKRTLNSFSINEKYLEKRESLIDLKALMEVLPEILGDDKKRSYLILFQNNMELRPTGGFIGSFAIVTFDKGRIAEINVSDVYSADGQLKGHIEPPVPIKNYLGEANWFLRDSNWDPDFPTSSERAEWFLDKEIDRKVDGVLAVNLGLVERILKETGPVRVVDFNEDIDYKNLYEKTQLQAESSFFPGSYKKANFLTGLTRALLDRVQNVEKGNYFNLAKAVRESLEAKDIQIFLHNKSGQAAIYSLGWDGGVVEPRCGGNCMADWLGVVEANVGVNKANYFIKRKLKLEISVTSNEIVKKLQIDLENGASPALGKSGKYKTYLRVLSPISSEFENVQVYSETHQNYLPPEPSDIRGHKESGVLIEVLPGENKKLVFIWRVPLTADLNQNGEYLLYLRKQAGTKEDPINIKILFPELGSLKITPVYSLTEEGFYEYNTTLARDFTSRVSW